MKERIMSELLLLALREILLKESPDRNNVVTAKSSPLNINNAKINPTGMKELHSGISPMVWIGSGSERAYASSGRKVRMKQAK